MVEEKKITMEEAVRFLDALERENEGRLTGILEEGQNVDQKYKEISYKLQELNQKQSLNINFFSPVGVYEEGEEKKNLLKVAEELNDKVPELNEELEQYNYCKERIQFIKDALCATHNEAPVVVTKEPSVLEKGQSLQILESQERDRNRIARDLHDSSVQSLTGLVHKAELCMRLVDIDTIRVKLELQTMIETIRTVINGMREIIYNLRPMSLDNLGLVVTIDSYCLQLNKNYAIDVNFQKPKEEPELPSIYKVTLYRILQEACGNVVKHAKASKVDIILSCEKNRLQLVIRDNGIGFDTEKVTEPTEQTLNGFGHSMMKERVTLLGGTIEIKSVVDEGTTVFVEIPLQEKEVKSGND